MMYLGLGALGTVPDPLARLSARWSPASQLVMGVLIGGFLIGRPWPLFHTMFLPAASTHNTLLGAATFVLVVIGNMVLMGVLFPARRRQLHLAVLGSPGTGALRLRLVPHDAMALINPSTKTGVSTFPTECAGKVDTRATTVSQWL